MFLGKGVLKICSKFAGEHLCRGVISIKLVSNLIEIVLRHGRSPVNLPFSKSGRSLNDLHDTTCMTQNRLSNFYGVYTIIQIFHTKFIKVVHRDYSGFRSSNKMI